MSKHELFVLSLHTEFHLARLFLKLCALHGLVVEVNVCLGVADFELDVEMGQAVPHAATPNRLHPVVDTCQEVVAVDAVLFHEVLLLGDVRVWDRLHHVHLGGLHHVIFRAGGVA